VENNDLLDKILAEEMNENLRNDIVKFLFKNTGRKTTGIPVLKNCPMSLNSDEIVSRMKTVAGGTCSGIAKVLGISSQGFNNQINRRALSGNSIIEFHLKTGISVDWLIGSWDGNNDDYLNTTSSSYLEDSQAFTQSKLKYLSLVETYDQNSGNVELKWCLTKHQVNYDDLNRQIAGDYSALLSIIIRYKDRSGTPDRVKNGEKNHFQVRKVLAYVLGDAKAIRYLDAQVKSCTVRFISGNIERPGKTEFRLHASKDECLDVFETLTNKIGLTIIKPEIDTIPWDFLIGTGSYTPRDWIIKKMNESVKGC
jgi:hypothetical protein